MLHSMIEPKLPKTRPHTLTLMLVNLLGWCVLLGPGATITYYTTTVLISTAGQLLLHFIVRKKNIKPWKRTLLFAVPSLLLILFFLLSVNLAPLVPRTRTISLEEQRRTKNESRITIELSPELRQLGVSRTSQLVIDDYDTGPVRICFGLIADTDCTQRLTARAVMNDGMEIGKSSAIVVFKKFRHMDVSANFLFDHDLNQDSVDKYEISIDRRPGGGGSVTQ